MKINKKTIWIVMLFVCIFTAAYLYYVSKERALSVQRYASTPRIGDIYIIQKETPEDGEFVYYLKVKETDDQNIYFYRSKLTAGSPYDVLLSQFDTSKKEQYSRVEMAAIASGKWMVPARDMTKLIEIERK